MTLPGVGEAEAEEIIWRREAYGPAMDLSELATQSRGGTAADDGEPSSIDSHTIDCFRDLATISLAE